MTRRLRRLLGRFRSGRSRPATDALVSAMRARRGRAERETDALYEETLRLNPLTAPLTRDRDIAAALERRTGRR